MKITFLGTGTSQGVPLIACNCPVCKSGDTRDKRLRSSVMVNINGTAIIIDAGPDFRQQMLRENVTRLDAVLITHGHKDHIGGLDDIRAYNYISGRPVDVYASKETETDIKRDLYYVFSDSPYPGIPRINLINIDNQAFMIKGVEVVPLEVSHHFCNILGFRIGNFVYITDSRSVPAHTLAKIQGAKVMVINALRKTEHISHLNLKQALGIIEKACPERAFITHISHHMGKHEDVSKELPEHVELAYDGLSFNVDP